MKTIGLLLATSVLTFTAGIALLSQTQEKSCCSGKATTTASAQEKSHCNEKTATTASVQQQKSCCSEKSATVTTASAQQEVRCPVTGKVITNLSKAHKIVYGGKTYYFANRQALETFRKNPARYANQPTVRTADLTTGAKKEGCCASGARATTASVEKKEGCCAGEAKATTASAEKKEGCCAGEAKATTASAEKKEGCCAEKRATAEQASKPSDRLVCPVSGEELTLEKAVKVEYNGKLYYVGCENCKREFLKDPATYTKKAESLSSLQGKPIEKTEASQ